LGTYTFWHYCANFGFGTYYQLRLGEIIMDMTQTTSNLLQRMWLALRAGVAFGGARDYYTVFGYNRQLVPDDLMAKYYRQDIARRIVDQPTESTWAYPPEVTDSSLNSVWKELKKRQFLPAILQADKLLAFDSYSVLWIGLPGDPTKPAATNSTIDQIAYITAHGAGAVKINKFDEDTSSPRFGLPTEYNVRIDRGGVPVSAALGRNVHWSRIVHISDVPLYGRGYSNPRLAVVYNLLEDLLKVVGGSAETYWLIANRGMQVDVDKDMQFNKGDADALSAEIDEYQHQLRRVMRTRGVKVNNLGADPVDPKSVFGVLISMVAATTGIPQRILMGAEAGTLASAQDRANWSEFMERRRTVFAEPYLLFPLWQRLETLGILKKDQSLGVEYIWPSAFIQNPLEVSQTQSATARALINLSRQSQYGTPYTSLEEGRKLLGLPPTLPPGETLYQAPSVQPSGKAKQTGGNPASGGSGGNDGSGNSGGGAQEPDTVPVSDGTADITSNAKQ
jgi:hypothetical protein